MRTVLLVRSFRNIAGEFLFAQAQSFAGDANWHSALMVAPQNSRSGLGLSELLTQTRVEARNDRSHLRRYATLLRKLLKQRYGAFIANDRQSLGFCAGEGTCGAALNFLSEGGAD